VPLIPSLEIDPASRDLRINGELVAIGARAFDVLVHLNNCSDRVVSKQELLENVWGGLTVEEGNLTVQISALRKVLGPRAIATVPGVGYKLATGTEPMKAQAQGGPSFPTFPRSPFCPSPTSPVYRGRTTSWMVLAPS
jgi:DNA-binding winged helix-turn-helix (wHTH) protein